VIVFVHGGAWTTGGGSLPWYDGARLAAGGAVVVTVNYRIGALGHLVAGDGGRDLPFEDLLCALRWVQENVGMLGGDPDRVTLVGQSAGGWYGHALSVSPAGRGLFRRAAHLSMATREPWTPRRRDEVKRDVERRLGGDPAVVPITSLMAAGAEAVAPVCRPLGFAPSAWLPTAVPGLPAELLDPAWCAEKVHVEAVLFRFTDQETGMFFFQSQPELTATAVDVDSALSRWDPGDVPLGLAGLEPYEKLVAASSWAQFQRLPTELAAAYARAGVPSRLERFTVPSLMPGIGSGHCFDLPFQFGTRGAFADAPMLAGIGPEEFEEISLTLRRQLLDFAAAPQPVTVRR
jgi:para-nitrobenzyl esterase